jgi:hypothetical protein
MFTKQQIIDTQKVFMNSWSRHDMSLNNTRYFKEECMKAPPPQTKSQVHNQVNKE